MCGPLMMLIGAVAGSMAMGLGSQQEQAAPPPPTPALPPAMPAPVNDPVQAEVKVGSDPDGVLDTRRPNEVAETFERRRVTANTFGNLGKSALTI